MERTKRINDGSILWKKLSGTIRLPDRRLIRAGQTFWAHPEDIPMPFRDTIVPVTGEVPDGGRKPVEKVHVVKSTYKKVRRGDSNWWNIVDNQGKQINEKALREDQADEYLKSLQG